MRAAVPRRDRSGFANEGAGRLQREAQRMDPAMFRRRMLAGEMLLGAWCMIGDMVTAEILGRSGYDWLVIDMEHGPLDLATAQRMATAIRTTPATPIVRVPWTGSAQIQPVLDGGPHGIVVPMVNTVEEARSVVRDARFLPLGERSRGGLRSSLAFGLEPAAYFAEGNAQTTVMVQIETAQAVRNADAIAALEGIDGLFVGPSDLASTYGVTYPQAWDPLGGEYGAAIEAIPSIARRHGKAAGILAQSAAMGRRCVDMGYTVVGIAIDLHLLAGAAKAERTSFGSPAAG